MLVPFSLCVKFSWFGQLFGIHLWCLLCVGRMDKIPNYLTVPIGTALQYCITIQY
jgi:hypothetical protein